MWQQAGLTVHGQNQSTTIISPLCLEVGRRRYKIYIMHKEIYVDRRRLLGSYISFNPHVEHVTAERRQKQTLEKLCQATIIFRT